MSNCENDTMSITGHNLRIIMLLTNQTLLSKIKDSDLNSVIYKQIPEGEEWRVHTLKELMEIRHNPDLLENFTYEEVDEMISFVSTT